MEQGDSVGTYLAYAVITLFWLIVALVVLRTVTLMGLLVLPPARRVWSWLARNIGWTNRR